jgi:hypothetical protein
MAHESVLKKIDETANLWNKTKDSKYKEQWYKLVKEFADGTYYSKRWDVSSGRSDQTDDYRNRTGI